jgi:hypothetical protein
MQRNAARAERRFCLHFIPNRTRRPTAVAAVGWYGTARRASGPAERPRLRSMWTSLVPPRRMAGSRSIERCTHSAPTAPGTLAAGGSSPALWSLTRRNAVPVPVPPSDRIGETVERHDLELWMWRVDGRDTPPAPRPPTGDPHDRALALNDGGTSPSASCRRRRSTTTSLPFSRSRGSRRAARRHAFSGRRSSLVARAER